MGEKRHQNISDSSNSNDPTEPQENNELEMPNDQDQNAELTQAEYQVLNSQLDALFTALDDIESKNDDLHGQLLQLLHANREIREQLNQDLKDTEALNEAGDNKNN